MVNGLLFFYSIHFYDSSNALFSLLQKSVNLDVGVAKGSNEVILLLVIVMLRREVIQT